MGFENSVDLDQIPQDESSNQGLHCLHTAKFLDTSTGSIMNCSNFRTTMVKVAQYLG